MVASPALVLYASLQPFLASSITLIPQERGFQRQSAGDPGVIGRSSAGALGGTGGGGIHQSASRSAIHKAVIQAAEAISQGTPPAMLLATGQFGCRDLLTKPAGDNGLSCSHDGSLQLLSSDTCLPA
jgi:hypothetical protein